jgi:hypothetical protein
LQEFSGLTCDGKDKNCDSAPAKLPQSQNPFDDASLNLTISQGATNKRINLARHWRVFVCIHTIRTKNGAGRPPDI